MQSLATAHSLRWRHAAARSGNTETAREILEAVLDPNNRRAVLVALAAAHARAGEFGQGLRYAAQIEEPQYRAVSLADLAGSEAAAGGAAAETLARAFDDAMAVDRLYGYARSNALAAVWPAPRSRPNAPRRRSRPPV